MLSGRENYCIRYMDKSARDHQLLSDDMFKRRVHLFRSEITSPSHRYFKPWIRRSFVHHSSSRIVSYSFIFARHRLNVRIHTLLCSPLEVGKLHHVLRVSRFCNPGSFLFSWYFLLSPIFFLEKLLTFPISLLFCFVLFFFVFIFFLHGTKWRRT